MLKIKFAVLFSIMSLILSGCVGNMSSIRHQFKVNNGKSQLIDVKQRGVYIGYKNKLMDIQDKNGDIKKQLVEVPIICAEPSPDAMSAYAAEMAAKGGTVGKATGELSGAMQESSAYVGMRTASIQALRDYGYRICEAYMSGGINEIQYESLLRRYQKNLVVLFAIEQLSGVNRVPTIALVSQGGTEQPDSSGQKDANAGEGSEENKVTKNNVVSTTAIVVPTNNNSPQTVSDIAQNIYDLSEQMITADEFGSLCLSVVQSKSFNESLGSNNTNILSECLAYLKENNTGVKTNSYNNPINPTTLGRLSKNPRVYRVINGKPSIVIPIEDEILKNK